MRPASVRYAFTDIGTSKTHAQIFDSDAMNATSNEMCAQRWERMRESLPKLKIFYGVSVNLTNSRRHRANAGLPRSFHTLPLREKCIRYPARDNDVGIFA